jgi:hypothetical protein
MQEEDLGSTATMEYAAANSFTIESRSAFASDASRYSLKLLVRLEQFRAELISRVSFQRLTIPALCTGSHFVLLASFVLISRALVP